MQKYRQNRLFATPSFFEGMARVVDLGATMQIYNDSKSEKEADIKALNNDWRAVGQDIHFAIEHYEQASAK